MANDTNKSSDLLALVAWADANRKRLLSYGAVVVIIGAVVGIYFWQKAAREAGANEALCRLRLPSYTMQMVPSNPADFEKVADDYPGSAAGARALVIAGGIYFDQRQYSKAESAFQKFLAQYPDNPFADDALLGLASSLDAGGKTADAIKRYEELIGHRGLGAPAEQARTALARLYLGQNKPEQAMRLYEELLAGNNNDTWAIEAREEGFEILAKYPKLRQMAAPASPPPLMNANQPAPVPAPTTPAAPTRSTNG